MRSIAAVAATIVFLAGGMCLAGEEGAQHSTATKVADEPAGHALYDAMIAAMRKAETLSYESEFEMAGMGGYRQSYSYVVEMKKPRFAKVEVRRMSARVAVLVGDGENFWTYWPGGRPDWGFDAKEPRKSKYAGTRTISYMRATGPAERHSIGHDIADSGSMMPIIDPSTFHGYTDSLQPHLDGVRRVGVETIDGIDCDVIELSYMDGQRYWKLWISRADLMPIKQRQVIHVREDMVFDERWVNVKINGDIPDKRFRWEPPEDWVRYVFPKLEDGLLQAGTQAPEFDLAAADGSRVRLADLRGKVVWFYLWRAG